MDGDGTWVYNGAHCLDDTDCWGQPMPGEDGVAAWEPVKPTRLAYPGSLRYRLGGGDEVDRALGMPGTASQRSGDITHAR
jgi:hypothetical protein